MASIFMNGFCMSFSFLVFTTVVLTPNWLPLWIPSTCVFAERWVVHTRVAVLAAGA